jgi:hypothetical protein
MEYKHETKCIEVLNLHPKRAKTHLRASAIPKIFPWIIPSDRRYKGRGGEGEGQGRRGAGKGKEGGTGPGPPRLLADRRPCDRSYRFHYVAPHKTHFRFRSDFEK